MRSGLIQTFALVLVVVVTVAVVEPIKGLLFNWDDLTIGIVELIQILLGPAALATLILLLPALVGYVVLRRRWLSLLTALVILLWLQGNAFLWGYGPFDGAPRDWDAHFWHGVFEAMVWFGLLLFALLKPRLLGRHSISVAGVVLAMQLFAVANTYISVSPLTERSPRLDTSELQAQRARIRDEIMSHSRNSNVIIIVIDTLQADYVAELMTDPEFAESVPPGFTFYRNATSTYNSTGLSLQNILTSRTVARYRFVSRWRAEQMKKSAPVLLAKRGYSLSMLSQTRWLLACEEGAYGDRCISHTNLLPILSPDVVSVTEVDLDHLKETKFILGITGFRVSPHFLKPWVYNDGDWRVPNLLQAASEPIGLDPRIWLNQRQDIAILEALADQAVATDTLGTFKFLHFFGVHSPHSVTASCEWNGIDNPHGELIKNEVAMVHFFRGRKQVIDNAACTLSLVFSYLRKLEEIGTYDGSLIFIVGDHGLGSGIHLKVASPPIPGMANSEPASEFSRGVPAYLAKRIGARHSVAVSDVPVALCDTPKSIFAELGIKSDFECESIFEMGESRVTERVFYKPEKKMAKKSARHAVREYRIRGHSWLKDSWVDVTGDSSN